jgi:hypothetical protein
VGEFTATGSGVKGLRARTAERLCAEIDECEERRDVAMAPAFGYLLSRLNPEFGWHLERQGGSRSHHPKASTGPKIDPQVTSAQVPIPGLDLGGLAWTTAGTDLALNFH